MEYAEKIKKVFSANLKYYMKKNDVSQKDISDYTQFSKQSVSNWVNGRLMPRMGVIEKLSQYFNIAKSDLLEEKSLINNLDYKRDINLSVCLDDGPAHKEMVKYENHRLIECGLFDKFRANQTSYYTWEQDYLSYINEFEKQLCFFSNKLTKNKIPLFDLDNSFNEYLETIKNEVYFLKGHIEGLTYSLESMYQELGDNEYKVSLSNAEKRLYLQNNYPTYDFDNKTNEEIDLLYDVFTSNDKI